MIRVTILDRSTEQRFVVEGRLTEPWVMELESAWERTRETRRGRKCVIDLSDTTAIDARGKRILAVMCSEGARFVAEGVATAYLVKDIQRECAQQQANTAGKKL